jgi:hypothetical protein
MVFPWRTVSLNCFEFCRKWLMLGFGGAELRLGESLKRRGAQHGFSRKPLIRFVYSEPIGEWPKTTVLH